jgi:hypothetical protein
MVIHGARKLRGMAADILFLRKCKAFIAAMRALPRLAADAAARVHCRYGVARSGVWKECDDL